MSDRRGSYLGGALAGVVVLAVLVATVVVLDQDTEQAEIALPERVGDLAAIDVVDDPAVATQARTALDYNDERLSDALGGVRAASRIYYSADQQQGMRITAYRLETSPLTPEFFTDPEASGAQVSETLEDHGEVRCLVTRSFTAGTPVEDGEVQGALCQRTDVDLTVRVETQGVELDEAIDEVNDLWAELA